MVRLRERARRSAAALVLGALALLLLAAGHEESEEAAARELARALHLEPDTANGLRVYRTCAVCHHPEGWGTPDGAYPQLAGQHRKVIIKQLADIRAGVRSNPDMHPLVSPRAIGGAQAVADVAGYIDTLEIDVRNGQGPGTDLERGKELYVATCARCHGANAEGDNGDAIPRLQAQHYEYLLRQFQAIRDGRRGNADPAMATHVQEISDADAGAILDYVSRLQPPPEFQAPPGWRNPDFPPEG